MITEDTIISEVFKDRKAVDIASRYGLCFSEFSEKTIEKLAEQAGVDCNLLLRDLNRL